MAQAGGGLAGRSGGGAGSPHRSSPRLPCRPLLRRHRDLFRRQSLGPLLLVDSHPLHHRSIRHRQLQPSQPAASPGRARADPAELSARPRLLPRHPSRPAHRRRPSRHARLPVSVGAAARPRSRPLPRGQEARAEGGAAPPAPQRRPGLLRLAPSPPRLPAQPQGRRRLCPGGACGRPRPVPFLFAGRAGTHSHRRPRRARQLPAPRARDHPLVDAAFPPGGRRGAVGRRRYRRGPRLGWRRVWRRGKRRRSHRSGAPAPSGHRGLPGHVHQQPGRSPARQARRGTRDGGMLRPGPGADPSSSVCDDPAGRRVSQPRPALPSLPVGGVGAFVQPNAAGGAAGA
mmetsp:Transcript_10284/g.33173  ORF Transcript_10284/g.33173 Transcript_10284/m.33173 type:complete len:343 (+) Transcript_10284:431-1459(+)